MTPTPLELDVCTIPTEKHHNTRVVWADTALRRDVAGGLQLVVVAAVVEQHRTRTSYQRIVIALLTPERSLTSMVIRAEQAAAVVDGICDAYELLRAGPYGGGEIDRG